MSHDAPDSGLHGLTDGKVGSPRSSPLDKTLRHLGSIPVMFAGVVLVLVFLSLVVWSIRTDYQDTVALEYEQLTIRARLSESQISGSFRSIDLLLRALGERRLKDPGAPPDSFRQELKNLRHLSISGITRSRLPRMETASARIVP